MNGISPTNVECRRKGRRRIIAIRLSFAKRLLTVLGLVEATSSPSEKSLVSTFGTCVKRLQGAQETFAVFRGMSSAGLARRGNTWEHWLRWSCFYIIFIRYVYVTPELHGIVLRKRGGVLRGASASTEFRHAGD